MNYQAVSELITSSNHNVLIVGDSASEVDSFLNKLNITDYKYYDFSQIYSCSDRTLNESAVMQFARVARKSGKQLIVAVREQDMKKMEAEFGRIIKIH
ncbi:hypothetical protein AWO57_003962 [Escherichia coli]|nr:hypothetical protein [Escherichia coli]